MQKLLLGERLLKNKVFLFSLRFISLNSNNPKDKKLQK